MVTAFPPSDHPPNPTNTTKRKERQTKRNKHPSPKKTSPQRTSNQRIRISRRSKDNLYISTPQLKLKTYSFLQWMDGERGGQRGTEGKGQEQAERDRQKKKTHSSEFISPRIPCRQEMAGI